MKFEEVIHTRNWSILKNIAIPLKIKMRDSLGNDLFNIAIHIQRHNMISPKGCPIIEEILYVDSCSKLSVNAERLLDYIADGIYLEYDVYKLSEVIFTFRLYFDSNVIRVPCLNKEFIFRIQMTEGEIKEIADTIISKLNIIE